MSQRERPDQPLTALANGLAEFAKGHWVVFSDLERVKVLTVRAPDGRLRRRMVREVDLAGVLSYVLETRAIEEMVEDLRRGEPSNAAPELFRVGGVACPVCGGQAVMIARSPDGTRRCVDGHEWRMREGVAVPEVPEVAAQEETFAPEEREPEPPAG